jgi:sterol desaturase/sphingolipid hydroxylase (fatty acid hydroxylase superfamily)
LNPFDLALDVLTWFSGVRIVLLSILLTLILYFGFRKRSALSSHAIQNSAASFLVAALNYSVLMLLGDEINSVLQTIYFAAGVFTLPADTWATTPLWLVAIFGLAAKDFADYICHRLMHTRWLWPTHAAHHSDTDVNAFTSHRVHLLEVIMMSLTYVVVLTWLQMPQAIPIVAVLGSLHNMYVHMDLDFHHGPLKYLIASPVFHRWHHADVPEAYGKNLANLMPIYDVIFGTYRVPGACKEEMGALKSGIVDKNPFLIWVYPFQEWSRLVRRAVRRRAARSTLQSENRDLRSGENVTPAQ